MENLIAWILMAADLAADFVPRRSRLPARRDAPDECDERGHATRCAMIAGVKGSAVLSALLILLPWSARAADDMAGAVRELARKTVALAGRGEPVSVTWRNLSSLPSGDFNQARMAFEAALRDAGVRAERRRPASRGPPHPLQQSVAVSDRGRGAQGRRSPGLDRLLEAPRIHRRARRLHPHAGQEAGLGTGRADSGRGPGRSRGPRAFALPHQPSHGRHGPIPAAHAAAPLAARPARTSARQRRRLQSLSAGHGVQRRHRPLAHHGVPPQRRALDPRRRPARRAPRQLRSRAQLLRWTRRPRPTASARRWPPSSPPHPPKRTAARTFCSPCWTAARRFSTPRSTP